LHSSRALTSKSAALSVEGVAHAFGPRQVLADVSFAIKPGQFAVLLGLNGAGKTTLFSLITRLYATRKGQIRVLGHELRQEPGEALRLLGVVFQSRTLDLDLSVMQNLLYHAALHGIGRREARLRSGQLLERVGLADRERDKVRNLSGGQMRRVEIARALLHHPKLLLLDEPTVGLDIKARADILRHVRRLVVEDGVAVLWATHLIDEIEREDQLLVLHEGRLLANDQAFRIAAENGAADTGEAFARLTGFDRMNDDLLQQGQ
jgi:ABC-2 type transport system ATP-binding protein